MTIFATFKDSIKSSYSRPKSLQKKAILATLFNLPAGFKILDMFSSPSSIHTTIRFMSRIGVCPSCSCKSSSVHSVYERCIQDLGIGGKSVTHHLIVHKLYCKNPSCSKKIFSQDVSSLVKRFGRNSKGAEDRISQISLESPSGKSSYILNSQSIHISPSTCLRRVANLSVPSMRSVRHIAIDDFAFKKGHTYGSIIIDQLTGKPVEMLNGRDAQTIEEFLKSNPQLLTITRDRGHCYSKPIEETMPYVRQVCDRFHLMKNLSDYVEKYVKSLSLKKKQQDVNEMLEYPTKGEVYSTLRQDLFQLGTARNIKKPQLYIKVHELMGQGLNVFQISEQLGIKSKYIYLYTRMTKIDHLLTLEQKTLLKYLDVIAEQISRGIMTSQELFDVLNAKVKLEWIARLTLNIRKKWKKKKQDLKKLTSKPQTKIRRIPSKDIFKQFFKEGYRTTCEPLEYLMSQKPKLQILRKICLQFRNMMNRNNQAIELRKWIEKAYNCGIPMMKKFAKGIMAEQQAVQEAIDCQWSNGIAEGTVNRVKNIKRQMYGKAGFELLRRKILLAKWG